MMKCYICQRPESITPDVELRPYGADGQPICFDCMIADPERDKEASRQFGLMLGAIGSAVAVLDGSSNGPRAATYEEAVALEDVLAPDLRAREGK